MTVKRPTTLAALAIIEHHHVAHGEPSVMEMHDLRAAMEAHGETGVDAPALAHDTLTAHVWHVRIIDGAIFRLER